MSDCFAGNDPEHTGGRVQQRAWRAYFETTAVLQDRLERGLRDSVGLRLADYNVLLVLTEADGGRLRMGELAERMVFSPSRLTYQVKSLEQRGLVTREASADDRRGYEAVLTDDGRRMFRRAAVVHARQIEELFLSELKGGEAEMLGQVFERVGKHLR